MAASNNRIKEFDTVHHLMSRIAHKVYILNDEDRNDFIEIIRRSADYVGVQLLGWCIMTNHFHLLVYLPLPVVLDEKEILRRYGVLKGERACVVKTSELKELREHGQDAEINVWLDSQRKRMYNIGSFMKICKQWFTENYNRRYAHTGTLWEGEYVDKPVKKTFAEMSKRLAYIHLNPIRAAMSDRYDGYAWSSFASFRRGDPKAIAGMRFIYDTGNGCAEMAEIDSSHLLLLDELLEREKRCRAEMIARCRATGQDVPCDHLTNETLVIQSAAHLKEVRQAGVYVWENRSNLFSQVERQVASLLYLNPSLEISDVIVRLNISKSKAYRVVSELKRKGLLERPDPSKPWIVNSEKTG